MCAYADSVHAVAPEGSKGGFKIDFLLENPEIGHSHRGERRGENFNAQAETAKRALHSNAPHDF